MITPDVKLVCIMMANNEIGTIQDIRKLVKIAKKKNNDCFFLCDCTQYIGKYNINVEKIGVDAISFSAHKFHGPRGIGCMYIKNPQDIVTCNTG